MVERIRKLLEIRQLTPTQFADAIGIARPIVSHILSGRNKPSLEVVQRILAAMPDLSMPWLLNGTGPMLAGAPVEPAAKPAKQATAELPPQAPPKPEKEKVVASQAPVTLPEGPIEPANSSRPATNLVAAASDSSPPPPRAATSARTPRPKRFTPALPYKSAQPVVEPALVDAPVALPMPDSKAKPEAVVSPEALPAPVMAPALATPMPDPTAAALFAGAEKPIRRIVIFYRDGSFADFRPE